MIRPTLLVYYSMSGHTRTLADELRASLDADVEEIREPRVRHGLSGVLRALIDAIARRKPPIDPPHKDPGDYGLLVLGGPVWAGRMASPVRTYAQRYGREARRVAFFCTEGGSGAEQAFAELQRFCGRAPVATLVVDAAHLTAADHHDALHSFRAALTPP